MQSPKWTTTKRSNKLFVMPFALVIFVLATSQLAHAEPWNIHTSNLSSKANQIKNLELSINELIARKKTTTNADELKLILADLTARHRELEQVSKDYESERLHVRFKHPDRNEDAERTYVRHQMKSLREMENAYGLDGRLDKIKAQVLSTFPLAEAQAQPKPQPKIFRPRKPASTSLPEAERIRLVK